MGGSNLNLGHAGPACKRRARGGRGVQSESGPAYGVIVIATAAVPRRLSGSLTVRVIR